MELSGLLLLCATMGCIPTQPWHDIQMFGAVTSYMFVFTLHCIITLRCRTLLLFTVCLIQMAYDSDHQHLVVCHASFETTF